VTGRRSGRAFLLTASAGCAVVLALAAASIAESATATTVITVVAGKPTDLAFTLSRFSQLPPGTFVFKVRNAGTSVHDFVLCQDPVRNAGHNACVGYQSRELYPGQTTTITIRSITRGIYEFLSSDPGDASGGMKGLLGVGVPVKQPHARPVPRTTPVAPVPSGSASGPSTAAAPDAPMTTAPSGNYTCQEADGAIQAVATPAACTGVLIDPNG
jgi:uncharacterized cupredoxin-like copper-binding protein